MLLVYVFRPDHLVSNNQMVYSFLGKSISYMQHSLVAYLLFNIEVSMLLCLLFLFSFCLGSHVGETSWV